jgi:hypothetical protein
LRFLGRDGGWRAFANACIEKAIKSADVEFMFDETFPVVCGLAGKAEVDVMVALRYAESMKQKYGERWYRRFVK